jgi:hypothetical protein
MTDFPCQCSHNFEDHFEIEFRKSESNWPCRICVVRNGGCLDYKEMDNLKYLELKAEGKI